MPVRRHLQHWRKARESNPTRSKPPQFSRLLDSLYCRAFQVTCWSGNYWQGRSDLNRESRFWRPMVCQLAYIPGIIADFRLPIADWKLGLRLLAVFRPAQKG